MLSLLDNNWRSCCANLRKHRIRPVSNKIWPPAAEVAAAAKLTLIFFLRFWAFQQSIRNVCRQAKLKLPAAAYATPAISIPLLWQVFPLFCERNINHFGSFFFKTYDCPLFCLHHIWHAYWLLTRVVYSSPLCRNPCITTILEQLEHFLRQRQRALTKFQITSCRAPPLQRIEVIEGNDTHHPLRSNFFQKDASICKNGVICVCGWSETNLSHWHALF